MLDRRTGLLFVLCYALALGCSHGTATSSNPAPKASASSSTAGPPPVAGKLLDLGDTAPRFTGLAHTGMSFNLEQFSKQRPCVVHFCSQLGAASCEKAMTALRDDWFNLRQILGMAFFVFPDDQVALREYAYERELPFLVVSDPDGAIAKAFGVGAVDLVSFVITPEGKIGARLLDPGADYLDRLRVALKAPVNPPPAQASPGGAPNR